MHTKAVYQARKASAHRLRGAAVQFPRRRRESAGTFDEGEGEAADFRAATDFLHARHPTSRSGPQVFVRIVDRARSGRRSARVGLIGIAPPVKNPVLVSSHARVGEAEVLRQGSMDELCPIKDMWAFYAKLKEPKNLSSSTARVIFLKERRRSWRGTRGSVGRLRMIQQTLRTEDTEATEDTEDHFQLGNWRMQFGDWKNWKDPQEIVPVSSLPPCPPGVRVFDKYHDWRNLSRHRQRSSHACRQSAEWRAARDAAGRSGGDCAARGDRARRGSMRPRSMTSFSAARCRKPSRD